MTPEQIETVTQFPTWLDTNRYCDLKREAAALRALLAEWEELGELVAEEMRLHSRTVREKEQAKALAEERGREIERLKAEERYWRHEIVTTRLCPVDHKQPHVSHDCVTEIEHRWKDAEARLAQVVEHYRLYKSHTDDIIKINRSLRLRTEKMVEQAEADVKALGFEAHPAVTMRLDRLVRAIRGLCGQGDTT